MRFDMTTDVIGYVTKLMWCSAEEDNIALFDYAFVNHVS
jgi:hypothetical protein